MSQTPTQTQDEKVFRKVPVPPDLLAKEIHLSENARTVLKKRYLRKGEDGQPVETEHEMFWRVAYHVALAEKTLGHDEAKVEKQARRYFHLLTDLLFFPNSPTFTGAGTPLGQLAACFVLAIEDDMGRTGSGIFETLRHAALIQQTGGGNGFSFSRLRPKGALVRSSNGQATGPVGFLRVYDQAFGEIAQGGSRRGANMAVLRVDHPDIEEFIRCKAVEGAIENFNISVGITDKFMQAVENDEDFELINPHDGQVAKTLRARALFDDIVKYAYRNGEPGVLFLDTANRENPVPHLYELEATNPCVTGDSLIYTDKGLVRARELFDSEENVTVVVDGRRGANQTFMPASRVFMTGIKPVYRLQTREGYFLRATAEHRIMTERGWVELQHLQADDRIHILNQKGGFGHLGTLEEGRVLGWLVGDGTINKVQAGLSFFGEEKQELAPLFASYVDTLVSPLGARSNQRKYPVGIVQIDKRNEARVVSDRLRLVAEAHGLSENKHRVPEAVFKGSEDMQRGFLQALFTADGAVLNNLSEGGSNVHLASNALLVLEGVQQLLLNFGIASRIIRHRRKSQTRIMPDGHSGLKAYDHAAQHELIISRANLAVFAEEIGFLTEAKQSRLIQLEEGHPRQASRETFLARVESITPDGTEAVYDLKEVNTHSFICNGIVIHNCGEQWLGPFENCCLGSVNLARHVTPDGQVDWEKLQDTIELSTQFLDHVVTANAYVPAIPQLREAAERVRRIGLGIMGLADMMYVLGVRYGSPEGQEFASQIMEFVRYHAMKTSIELAKKYGPFLAIKGSRYDSENLGWKIPQPLVPHVSNWGRPKLNWKQIEKDLKKHGIRNGAQLTVAPTGTISTVSGCEGYGCEPVFALAYIRYVVSNAGNSKEREALQYTSPLFQKALEKAKLSPDQIQRIVEQVNNTGTCQNIPELPESIRRVFVVAGDISAEEHIRMQAAIQAFTDNSISKTCNFPATATPEDVAKVYMLGWKLGCKGLTVYVTGSRDKVVLETKETLEKKNAPSITSESAVSAEPIQQPLLFNEEKKPRPRHLTGKTYRSETPAGTTYITINENGYGEGQPFEVFIHTAKAGTEIMAIAEAVGRLISYTLRLSSPVSPRKRLKEIVRQFMGIGGTRTLGFGPNRVQSLPDGIAQVLEEYLEESEDPERNDEHPIYRVSTPASNGPRQEPLPLLAPVMHNPLVAMVDICPACGSASLVNEEGCRKCYSCGYSEC
jgi:ribonucleoside-diphosphate reductase alpha chain